MCLQYYDAVVVSESRLYETQVFKSGLSKFCGRQPLKSFKGSFLKAVFHKIYLIHSWILCGI